MQAAISDVGIRDRTWRDRMWRTTRRLRTVTAAGTAGDGQHTDNGAKPAGASVDCTTVTVVCPGFWLSIYFRPYGALVQYWEQRAWRGQGAAVA